MIIFTEHDPETRKDVVSPETYLDHDGQLAFHPKVTTERDMCHICGEVVANAIWSGDRDIQVCHRCALSVLPALIADAVVGFASRRTHFGLERVSICEGRRGHQVAKQIQDHFWRAYAIALETALRRSPVDHASALTDSEQS